MSKARAIIMSVELEGLTQSEAAARYAVSKGWVSKLMARYRAEGDAAFEPRSRRPKTSPTKVADVVNTAIVNLREDLVARGLDAGPHTIQWHLQRDGHTVSVSTIRRRLLDAGLIEPAPKKRPKSSYIRFEADLPNETWQSDFTHYRLADGADTEVLVWLDDHSRYALSVSAHVRVTGDIVVDTFDQCEEHSRPGFIYFSDDGDVVAMRYHNWKFVFMEHESKGTLYLWMNPFKTLRIPKVFNLRTDPFEYADITSNTFYDSMLRREFLFAPAQQIVAEFLETFKEFPPRQAAPSFSLDQVLEKLQSGLHSN